MNPPRFFGPTAIALLLIALGAAPLEAQDGLHRAAADGDPRSTVWIDYRCTSALGLRSITLFANGTVRLKRRFGAESEMRLGELDPAMRHRVRRRLLEVDPSDGLGDLAATSGVDGAWIDRCTLDVRPPGRPAESFALTPYDTPPLRVARLRQLIEDLARRVLPPTPAARLPADYEPALGDVLEDRKGDRFRVVEFTADGLGVGVDGIEQPLRRYVAIADLAQHFVRVGDDDDFVRVGDAGDDDDFVRPR
ncbi:MAG: hypothetical protein AAF772_06740 [Acidobacteriota bacterium]